jgi:hypothetical protein
MDATWSSHAAFWILREATMRTTGQDILRERSHLPGTAGVRHWTDEAVIGSELFVRELATAVLDPVRAQRKRLAKGHSPAAPPPLGDRRRAPAPGGIPMPQDENQASPPQKGRPRVCPRFSLFCFAFFI